MRAWLPGPSRSTPGRPGGAGRRRRASRSAPSCSASPGSIPVLGVLVGAGALLGPGRQPVPPAVRRARRAPALAGRPTSSRAATLRAQDALAVALLGVATLCVLIGLGGSRWIVALVEAGVAVVAATTGVHLGVVVRDRLRRALTRSRAQRAARTATAATAPSTTHADDRRDRVRARRDRRSRAPRARRARRCERSTPARPARRALAAPKHRHGTWRACARTSTTVNAASSTSATTPGHRAPPHDERDRDHAARPPGAPARSAARARRSPSARHLRAAPRRATRSFADRRRPRARRRARPAPRAPATRRSRAVASSRQLSNRPYPPR